MTDNLEGTGRSATPPPPSQGTFSSFPFDVFAGSAIAALLAVIGIAASEQLWLYLPLSITAFLATVAVLVEWVRRHNATTNVRRSKLVTAFGVGMIFVAIVLVIGLVIHHGLPASSDLTFDESAPPNLSVFNSAVAFDSTDYTAQGILFVKNEGGPLDIRSSNASLTGAYSTYGPLEEWRARKLLAMVRPDVVNKPWFSIQGTTKYRMPLTIRPLAPWEYSQLEAQTGEFIYADYIVARNKRWVRHFFFCYMNAGPATTTAPCPSIPNSTGEGP